MTTPAMTTTTVPQRVVAFHKVIARHSATVKDLIRRARSRFARTASVDETYTRQLAKDVFRGRSRCIEQCVTLLVDIAQNSTADEAAGIAQQFVAITYAEHAAAHPEEASANLSVSEALKMEELAEGAVECAEMALAQNLESMTHAFAYLRASADHTYARRRLDESVHRAIASTMQP